MSTLSFIAEVVDSLAWPVALLAVFWFLRKQIRGLLPFLQRLKYKDFEIEFGAKVEEVREEARAALPPQAVPRTIAAGLDAVLVKKAEVSPRATVLDTWLTIEQALLAAAGRHNLDVSSSRSSLAAQRSLESSALINPQMAGIITDLRVLRNEAAHAPDFAMSPDASLGYAETAREVAEYLSGL